MGTRKGWTKQGLETLAKMRKAYNEMSSPTPQRVAEAVGMSKKTALEIWPQLSGGKTWMEDLKSKIRAYLMIFPGATAEETAEYLDIPVKPILQAWADVSSEFKTIEDDDDLLACAIQIPDFIPKAKKFKCNDGTDCYDINEFFGIVENGGECYKNVHYTIPKGYSDTYKGSKSDFYI